MKKYLQIIGIWCLITPLAILNGGFREYVLVKLGSAALPLSGILLSACVFLLAYLLIPKVANCKKNDYVFFGFIWFILSNLFDLTMALSSGQAFIDFLRIYDVTSGNLWLLVVCTTLVSPYIIYKMRRLNAGG